ncbi:MAG: YidB family protein [Burkholderiales bacterium]|jgi:uncharacterized protein YidB (DUF937 family)|nr:YidB family protein [Burkholderiales bacterium]
MGLLDQLAGGIGGQLLQQLGGGGGQQNPLVQTVLGLLQQPGGLQGLLDKLQQSGLGAQAASWVGTGANLPVDAGQLQQALGGDWMSALAAQLGTSPEQASQSVASLLPDVVDKLTPDGKVGDLQSLVPQDLASLLGGKLFG